MADYDPHTNTQHSGASSLRRKIDALPDSRVASLARDFGLDADGNDTRSGLYRAALRNRTLRRSLTPERVREKDRERKRRGGKGLVL